MHEYKIIFSILDKVISGSNLNQTIDDYKTYDNYPKIKNITYNCIRYYYAINFIIDKLVRKENLLIKPILIVGVCELWLSKKPSYAIINDLVEYTKNNFYGLHGLVNATLRNFIKNKEALIFELEKNYSYKFNLPDWLINTIKVQYKNQALNIFQSFMEKPSFGLRVNNNKINQIDYLNLLEQTQIHYQLIDNKILLDTPLTVDELIGFNDGLVSIQDIAAQYLINILHDNNVSYENGLDACAAPGGKTCQLLENYSGKLTALDISILRLNKIKQSLLRLDLTANLICGDASKQDWWNGIQFDFILADVPCSALGTIKRNPDIKITRLESDIVNFIQTQRNIIKNLWEILENNGFMVYSTCSILTEENELNIEWFTKNLDNFILIDSIKILPTKNNDGLFYALIKKEAKL